MEGYTPPESIETKIEQAIADLEVASEMNPGDITSDFVTFAPYEGNETSSLEYFDQMAEELGIPRDNLIEYALQKAKEFLGLEE